VLVFFFLSHYKKKKKEKRELHHRCVVIDDRIEKYNKQTGSRQGSNLCNAAKKKSYCDALSCYFYYYFVQLVPPV
jgi:hypothetical protein